MSAEVITHNELYLILRTRYPNAYIRLLDGTYNIPTEDSFKEYLKELGRHLFALYGDKWQEYFDCDNFTLEAIALAYRKHWIARQENKGNAQGVTIGAIVVDGLKHALNVRVKGDKSVEEWEPQTKQPVILSSAQCASVSLVLFS